MNRYAIGDQIPISATLLLNGAPEDLTGATVQAALLLPDRSALATGTAVKTTTIVSVTGGQVSATWPSSETGSLPVGTLLVEFQITRSGQPVTVEHAPIEIFQGRIP